MRLVDSKLIVHNINHHYGLNDSTLDQLRIGTAHYIVDLGKNLEL
jgi:predicted Zn-dependent protease with MMP-like domain